MHLYDKNSKDDSKLIGKKLYSTITPIYLNLIPLHSETEAKCL